MSPKPQISDKLRREMVNSAKTKLTELVDNMKPYNGITIIPLKETRAEVVRYLNGIYQPQFGLETGKGSLKPLYRGIVTDAAEELGIERHNIRLISDQSSNGLKGEVLPERVISRGYLYWVRNEPLLPLEKEVDQ